MKIELPQLKFESKKTGSSTSNLKITDLNIDCLEIICKYLSISDLLNVAETNQHLKQAADLVFNLKYSKKTIEIYGAHHRIQHIDDLEYSIVIYNLLDSLKAIRCFGHLVKDLQIYVDRTDYIYKRYVDRSCHSFECLITYVNQYCAVSLIEFKLFTHREVPGGALNHLKRPFVNVEKLSIVQFSNMKQHLITKLFPRVRFLIYADSPFFDGFTGIDTHFPHLEHLNLNIGSVKYRYTSKHCEEKTNQICSTLRLNPQLQTLTLPFVSDMNMFECISELPCLETLKLYNFWGRPTNRSENVVHLKSVKKLKIDEFYEDCPQIPLSFDHLEELRIFCRNFCDNFHNFLIENPTIRKITTSPNILKNDRVQKLANALPFLEEIDVRDLCTEASDILRAIDGLESMKKISFSFKLKSDELSKLQSHLNRKWKCFTKHCPNEVQWFECIRTD